MYLGRSYFSTHALPRPRALTRTILSCFEENKTPPPERETALLVYVYFFLEHLNVGGEALGLVA